MKGKLRADRTAPSENRIIARKIRSEIDSMLAAKSQFDSDFPDHQKELSSREVRKIARERVMLELCDPEAAACEAP
jgi:hypothetical protein